MSESLVHFSEHFAWGGQRRREWLQFASVASQSAHSWWARTRRNQHVCCCAWLCVWSLVGVGLNECARRHCFEMALTPEVEAWSGSWNVAIWRGERKKRDTLEKWTWIDVARVATLAAVQNVGLVSVWICSCVMVSQRATRRKGRHSEYKCHSQLML